MAAEGVPGGSRTRRTARTTVATAGEVRRDSKWATGAVLQTCPAVFIETIQPPVRALTGNPHLLGHVRRWPVVESDALNKESTTMNRQPGVSVNHGDPGRE